MVNKLIHTTVIQAIKIKTELIESHHYLYFRLLLFHKPEESHWPIQWNLSVTTTSLMKLVNCDLFSNVF